MSQMSWWEEWTARLTGGPGGSPVIVWVGLVLAALIAGVAVGWWLRGRAGRVEGLKP